MPQNKEQLDKLLKFIKRLVDEPGNDDFVNKLRKILRETPPPFAIPNPQLSDIKKYLGLDYQLDSTSPIIDYSFVEDEYVKNQLVSDFREMLRYRYGVRSHKIDFPEYCRYVILQVEQLINYYYNKYFHSSEDVKEYIAIVDWAKIDNVESTDSLSLAIKLSAFTINHKDKKLRDILDFAREVRNVQSHRGSDKAFKTVADYRSYLEGLGLPLTRDGEVFWNKIKDDEKLKAIFQSINKAEYWNYRFQIWYIREPFSELADAIISLSKYIKEDLTPKSL